MYVAPAVEIIQDLYKMVEKLLRQHGNKNNLPKKVNSELLRAKTTRLTSPGSSQIVYFRDGVSEGKFEAVLDHGEPSSSLAFTWL